MNSAKFKEYIKNPVNLSKSDEADLKELLEEYPYFNAGQVMLAKIYKNEDNFRFEKQLKLAAMHAGDRSLLFDYLHAEATELVEETKAEKEPIAEVAVEPEIKVQEKVEPEIEEKEEQPEPTLEIKSEPKPEPEPEEKPATMFTLDADVTEADEVEEVSVSLSTTVHIKPDIEIEEKEEEQISKEEEVEEEVTSEVKEETIEPEKESTASSFYDWLELKSKREQEGHEEKEEVQQPKLKVNVDDLIGKFLKEQPTISKPKAEFYNPTDMAQRSVEDSNDIVSESLAKLYLKQKLYKKAISAYEKLCLLIPEKSETFASQIEKIKEEHNID